MSLPAVLAAIEHLHDLPALLAELGSEPMWQELDPIHGCRAALVGRRASFDWLGIEVAAPPLGEARRFARRLAGTGRVAGIVALCPATREIAVAVALGESGALAVHLDAPSALALASLRRLRLATGSCATAVAARTAEILAGRNAGHEFFCQFRVTLTAVAESIRADQPLPDSARRTVALIQLTRVLFLYFVQSKGWLDGRGDFLSRAVDSCLARRRGLQRRLLEPLFFGTLNRPASERSAGVADFGAIPFLNGGLFEPHPLERIAHPRIPDPAWRDAFDSLFERYHFTASETDGTPGSIAPDMLGRVFEGLMEPVRRKASGTYYTPAILVRDIVDASLAAAIAARKGVTDQEAADRLRAHDPDAIACALDLTILDPACGSGAFLLGALERLSEYRCSLGIDVTQSRREVLRRNLFGVDSDAIAVRLAELRLWLAVVADDPAAPGRGPDPLPNLDCFVRQGDSLFTPLDVSAGERGSRGRAVAIGRLRSEVSSATGRRKADLVRQIRRVEVELAAEGCRRREEKLEQQAAELIEAARVPDLFGSRRTSRTVHRRLAGIRAELHEVRRTRRRVAQSAELPWLHYQSAFADVFANGGFDVVMGNPPWVRAEELSPAQRERLAKRFSWWRGQGGRGFAHQPDLAVAFLERAHELTRPGGTVAMLVPAKLLAAGYGRRARAALASQTTVHAAADLTHDPRAHFNATVYPLALVTSRRAPAETHRVRTVLEPTVAPAARQARLGSGPWIVGTVADLAERLATLPRFGDRFPASLGVKTGADAVFVEPPGVEAEHLRWAVRGRDVRAFRVNPRKRLLWTHDDSGRPLADLGPRARAHLELHAATLTARADYRGGPLWTVFRVRGAAAPARIVWPDLATTLSAAALTEDARAYVVLNTCYVCRTRTTADAHAAAAWLNSTGIRGLARAAAAPASAGYARFTAATVGDLPLFPERATADLAAIGRAAADGQHSGDALDDLVARILELGTADRDALRELADPASHRR